jgi:Pin2-interacting protein X1
VHHKLDMLGIGAQHTKDPNGIAWKQNRDFENLLKRLNANSEDPTEDGTDPAPIDGFHPGHVDEPTADATTVGPETDGKGKKKKRIRDNETAEVEEKKSKKRKKIKPTITAQASEPAQAGSSSSDSPTPGTIAFVTTDRSHPNTFPDPRISSKPHRHGRAHRARFIASKRLAATSSVAVAEILGISSSSVTPLSVSGVATPEVTPQAEGDEHGHLTVSSMSVADYFKEKMRLVVSKPPGSETETDEALRGGIGSRLKLWGRDEAEEDEGLRNGIGMGSIPKISATEWGAMETPLQEDRKESKRRSKGGEDEMNRKSKKKDRKRARATSD